MSGTRRGGQRAVRAGAEWEHALDELHALYAGRGRALVLRCPPPVRVVRTSRGPQIVHTAAGPADYVGLIRGERATPIGVALEAKATSQARWPLRDLREHQAVHLDAWERMGGVGAVLLLHRPSLTRWVLPWHAPPCAPEHSLQAVWSSRRGATRGGASLGLDDLARIGARFDSSGWIAPLLLFAAAAP